ICIAAHVNAAHGVAMRNIDFGGQTRIAYTQDHNLHALEVTDLTKHGRYATQSFFDGSKPEYPRRMRCIQGSDAHRLDSQVDRRGKVINFGVGERATELRLRDQSFESLLELFESADFASSRPYIPGEKPEDDVQAARVQGTNLVQAFYDAPTQGGVLRYNVLADICAFANTHGGTLYLGMGTEMFRLPSGIDDPQTLVEQINRALDLMLSPALELVIDTPITQGKQIIRVQVPRGAVRPFALENNKIYIRTNSESILASRDQIVALVIESQTERDVLPPAKPIAAIVADETKDAPPSPTVLTETPRPASPDRHRDHRRGRREQREPREPREQHEPPREKPASVPSIPADELPRIGVEVVAVEPRGSLNVYAIRDLRTGSVTKNITRMSASKLWRYVIKQQEVNPVVLEQVRWNGDYGLWRKYRRLAEVRYDIVLRSKDGVRYFYGVPETELKGGWKVFAGEETLTEDSAVSVSAPVIDEPATTGAPKSLLDAGAADTTAKRKRRRRGGRHRKAGAEVAAAAQVDGAQPEVEEPAAEEEPSTSSMAEQEGPVETAPAQAEESATEQPVVRKRRTTRRKPAESAQEATPTKSKKAAAPAVETTAEEPAAKPKVARKRTTKTGTKAASTKAKAAEKPADVGTAEKPAATRKRRSTSKKADKKSE
ncbi:MAG: putative DNA binding domain-containing protein, partial [Anaerolineae bacterium]|nr:putative DNA binding domain-containing protein [Anaerolineae bacterium]